MTYYEDTMASKMTHAGYFFEILILVVVGPFLKTAFVFALFRHNLSERNIKFA